MSRRLAHDTVVVQDEEAVVLPKGSVPPAWAADQITNPSALLDDEPEVSETPAPPVAPVAVAVAEVPVSEGGDEPEVSETPAPTSDGSQAPAGNAATEAWAEYAQALGVEVPEDSGREDIKTLLRDRGLLES